MVTRPPPRAVDPLWKRFALAAVAIAVGLSAHYAPGLTGLVRVFGTAAAFLAVVLAFLPRKPKHGWFYPVTVLTVAIIVILAELVLATHP